MDWMSSCRYRRRTQTSYTSPTVVREAGTATNTVQVRCAQIQDVNRRQTVPVQSVDGNPMTRMVIDPGVDQLRGEMTAIDFRVQTDRVSPVHATRGSEVHGVQRLVDHRWHREQSGGRSCFGQPVHYLLNLIAKQSKRDGAVREEVRKSVALTEVLGPTGLVRRDILRRKRDKAWPSVRAFFVQEIGQFLQGVDSGINIPAAGTGGTKNRDIRRLDGTLNRYPVVDIGCFKAPTRGRTECPKQLVNPFDPVQVLIRFDAGSERWLSGRKRGTERVASAHLVLDVTKVASPPCTPIPRSADHRLVYGLPWWADSFFKTQVGLLRGLSRSNLGSPHQYVHGRIRERHLRFPKHIGPFCQTLQLFRPVGPVRRVRKLNASR